MNEPQLPTHDGATKAPRATNEVYNDGYDNLDKSYLGRISSELTEILKGRQGNPITGERNIPPAENPAKALTEYLDSLIKVYPQLESALKNILENILKQKPSEKTSAQTIKTWAKSIVELTQNAKGFNQRNDA